MSPIKPWSHVAVLAAALVVAPLGMGDQDPKKPGKLRGARHLIHIDNWVKAVKIETKESAPPQFDVILTLAMPTPGWKLKVDKVARPDAEDRIQVSITGTRPAGMWPQVITNTKVRVPLGRLPKGRYVLDVLGRHDAGKAHRRMGAALLHAFDKWGE